jgi:hypothetical protein
VQWIYGSKSNLFYHDKVLKSAAGTQQGDPLGPFLFCLIQQRFLRRIPEKFEISYKKFYMDDGNLVLPLVRVPEVIQYFVEEGRKVGLELNIRKCELWAPNLSTQLFLHNQLDPNFDIPDLAMQPDSGVIVLGGPVSTVPDYVVDFFNKRIAKVSNLISLALTIDNSQAEFLILRSCIAVPQLGFHLRVCPTNWILNGLVVYDQVIAESITKISGGIVTSEARNQLTLPVPAGGLGLSSAFQIAPAAFLGSVAKTSLISDCSIRPQFREVSDLLVARFSNSPEDLKIRLMSSINLDSLSTGPSPQKTLTSIIKEKCIVEFESKLVGNVNSTKSLARWMSIKNGSAKQIFSCIPDEKFKTFSNAVFACIIRHHLGIPHEAKRSEITKCKFCDKYMDLGGTHAIDCKKNSVVQRHDSVKFIIAAACRGAGIASEVEQSGIDPDSRVRPADVTIHNWDQVEAWVDVAVVNPCCPSMWEKSASSQNYAVEYSAKLKRRKYATLVADMGVTFIPIIMDVYGNMNAEGVDCLKRIAKIGGRRNGSDWKFYFRETKLKLVCSVLASTANQILNCLIM